MRQHGAVTAIGFLVECSLDQRSGEPAGEPVRAASSCATCRGISDPGPLPLHYPRAEPTDTHAAFPARPALAASERQGLSRTCFPKPRVRRVPSILLWENKSSAMTCSAASHLLR